MGIICVKGIRTYSYHGCLAEEAVIGANYVVDVKIKSDFTKSVKTDELADTVDYCLVHEIVKREMSVRSKLIEHVAQRIATALKKEIRAIEKVRVRVTKIAAPLNGDVDSVSVTTEC